MPRSLCIIAACLTGGAALAHGIEGHVQKGHERAEKKEAASWLAFFSRAEAAAHVRVETAGGWRYIKADGLPDHATGQFPNRGNPNSIKPQSYELRVTLAPVR